jgi:hypothetical protein
MRISGNEASMQLKLVVLALAALPLAGCATSGASDAPSQVAPPESGERGFFARMFDENIPNAGPCPLMGVLYDSSRLVEFAQPGTERYANVAFTGELQGVRGLCRYAGSDPIEMALEIDMAFGRGPAATADQRTYRYWVAVTRRGLAPIEKQYFDVPVRFERGADVMVSTQQIERIVIPRANSDISGENFEILIGFELTPEQLQFNRDGKRFRVNAPDNN